jgi:molybdate transport repressor ModE-like protein
MTLSADVRWKLRGEEVDPRLLALVRAVGRRGSLKQAIVDAGLSYRHAWGLLGRFQNLLGQPLVELQRGRGARVTPLGTALLETTASCERELAPQLRKWSARFNRGARRMPAGGAAVTVQASHDLALVQLRDLLARTHRVRLDLTFHGSLDALQALARGQCDFAGFHVPDSPLRSLTLEAFRPYLEDDALRVVRFANREQGLMVARGNPLRIRSVADLAKRKVRFVNRQPGSGTRLFFDQLLAAGGIRPARISGYSHEEFTHAAVAATVASGMADCGFGIEAAARQHGLDFVPVATERYFLAARRNTFSRPGPRALLAALAGASFRRMLRGLPGYALVAEAEPAPARSVLA